MSLFSKYKPCFGFLTNPKRILKEKEIIDILRMNFGRDFMRVTKSAFSQKDLNIKTEHFRSEEITENGKILHDFVGFSLSDTEISDIDTAKTVAKKLGEEIFPYLDDLIKNASDEISLQKYEKTRAWIDKKAVWHPALVERCTHKLLQKMKNGMQIKKIPLPYKEIYKDLSVVAVLHDIGRLSEVDIAQGCVNMKRSGLNKNHAAISFDILEHAKIKPEILLAVRYHEFADVKEAVNDDVYKKLEPENRKIAEFYIRVLQDMDKTANLLERSKFGIKKCAEFFDPHYVQDYDLTAEHFKTAVTGNYLNLKGGHLLDAMMRFVTWTYSIHFTQTKEMLSEILTDFFRQMYQEALREYNNSEDKDAKRLADTLEKITKLEDYAVFERTGMEINTVNRQKVLKQIAELRNFSNK